MVAFVPTYFEKRLTGEVRYYLKGFWRRITVQVEVEIYKATSPLSEPVFDHTQWRDAKPIDLGLVYGTAPVKSDGTPMISGFTDHRDAHQVLSDQIANGGVKPK